MGSSGDLEAVEKIINYQFKSKALLSEALTAAGADIEQYDGNRKLSEIGAYVIDFCVCLHGFENDAPRGKNNRISSAMLSLIRNKGQTSVWKQKLQNSDHRALIARRTGIDKHIRYNIRSGTGQSRVIGKAVTAIIAAVYWDCRSHTTTWEIMQHIGLVLISLGRNTTNTVIWQFFCAT